ncbi:hypothetical protein JCM19236_2771 [Vibrio sp. JCM 19236]|nr:hypothetical protein JCM19236_2771 [Vibrio sp. JCM 19236]
MDKEDATQFLALASPFDYQTMRNWSFLNSSMSLLPRSLLTISPMS